MNQITVEIPLHQFQDIFITSIRYCIERQSYLNIEGLDNVYRYWHLLGSSTRAVLFRDIKEFVTGTGYYSSRDEDLAQEWQPLLKWLEENYDKPNPQAKTAQPLNAYLPVVDPKLMTSRAKQTS